MKKILIRYNTENNGKGLFWRVLIEGEEKLTDHVNINVPCWTSKDTLADGRVKFHITCESSNIVITKELIEIN